ncbi:hypothetical protein SLOPH_1783 [Spraguea lophii 42_110]|uniref:K Homology domain-containing protein n=1 Tax=Spraguea lophii (strain 42_110) TaxID=1358809 RepID=S7W9V9_SPRLO|nr:hypothetical protein SLOPH_1783 [Spraguea lophii 42_110]
MVKKIKNVFPGEILTPNILDSAGIKNKKSTIIGTLHSIPNAHFLLSKTKYYTPSIDDLVIGDIIYVCSEYYKVSIGHTTCVLPSLSFFNATKRNRPMLKKGDTVLARVIKTGEEPLIGCDIEGLGQKKGYFYNLDQYKIKIIYMNTDLLQHLGRKYKFDIALGMNGRVWIECDNGITSLKIYNYLNSIK